MADELLDAGKEELEKWNPEEEPLALLNEESDESDELKQSPGLGDVDEAEYADEAILPEEIGMNLLCKVIKTRVRQDLDAVLCVSGEEGSGKSHTALKMARKLDKKFSLERNVLASATAKEIVEKARTLPRYAPIIIDEAIKPLYKRNFATRANILMNQFFTQCRKLNLIYFLCIPRFSDLDQMFREQRVLLNLAIPSAQDTGIIVVHRRDDNPYLTAERWHLNEAYKQSSSLQGKLTRFDQMTRFQRLKQMEGTPNWLMTFKCNFDKELNDSYKEFISKKQDNILDIEEKEPKETRVEIYKDRLLRMISLARQKGVELPEIAGAVNMKPTALKAFLTSQGESVKVNAFKKAVVLNNKEGDVE